MRVIFLNTLLSSTYLFIDESEPFMRNSYFLALSDRDDDDFNGSVVAPHPPSSEALVPTYTLRYVQRRRDGDNS